MDDYSAFTGRKFRTSGRNPSPYSDVAKQLKIAPETLRKYANLVDKINGENFFTRDSNNSRMYSKKDITLLKRVIELKKTQV
ncbi:MerR family transcriptional regulator [Ruoffia tabacinasalis]|uniref:MerR family transcriptional regulator n=1 Tax=Ruoffia tabacinasalis TaxID=87458 RepID=UPI003CC80FB7